MKDKHRMKQIVAGATLLLSGILGLPGSLPQAQAATTSIDVIEIPAGGPLAPVQVTNYRCGISPVQPGYGVRAPGQPGFGMAALPDLPPCATRGSQTTPDSPTGLAATDLNNHGGPVITSSAHWFTFLNCPSGVNGCFNGDWGDPFGFLSDLFASTFIHVTDQYTGQTSNGRYTTSSGGKMVSGAQPHTLTDTQLHGLLMLAVRAFFPSGGGGGYHNMYSFFLPPGQDLCFDSSTSCYCPDNNCGSGNTFAFCAYHGSFDSTDAVGAPIHVIFQAQPFDNVGGCNVTNGPNGALKDSVNNVFSHEIFETITDPDLNAWWRSSDGQEIADICSFNLQNPIKLNGRSYAIQKEYSNLTHTCFAPLPGGLATHDFDGNGNSDIAWRDTSGNTAVWNLSGSTILSNAGLGNVPNVWSIVGQHDFDGTGKHDWLWRDTSGNVAFWFLNGTVVSSSVGIGSVPTNWTIVGAGDFNGDGKDDILWRDSSGNVAIWLLNGSSIIGSAGLGNVPTNWTIVGTGDFNGDGNRDILWRDSTGNVAIWFLNGTTVTGSVGLGGVPTVWTIVGTGDFNGDNKWDILWRDTSGNVAVWLLNGSTVIGSAGFGAVPNVWTIQDTGDYNSDGKSDILWHDSSGNVALWYLNGTSVSGSVGIGSASTVWAIQTTNVD